MALQTTGAISLANIQTEFGGANPISISEYYGKDTVPASGTISLGNFYGTSDAPAGGTISAIWSGNSQTSDGTLVGIGTSGANWRFTNNSGDPVNGPWLAAYTTGFLQVGSSLSNDLGIIVQANGSDVLWRFATFAITGLVTFTGGGTGWSGTSNGGYAGAVQGFFTSGGAIRYAVSDTDAALIGAWITLT